MRFLAALALVPALALGGGASGLRSEPVRADPALERGPADAERAAPPVVRDDAWAWPVDVPRQVIRPFVAPPAKWGAGHRGVDLAAGTVLLAPAEGVVRFAGIVVDRGVLSIDHGGGVVSSYEPVTALVVAGDAVRVGEPVATIDPGHCASPCVHMGVRVDGEYANPLRWLGGVPRSVLLPTRTVD